jgi:hypothetical protein
VKATTPKPTEAKPPPELTTPPSASPAPVPVAVHRSSRSSGSLFKLLMFALLGVAGLAIAVAAVPPWLIRPQRLAAIVGARRSETAMLGIVGIISIGAAYLLTRAGG